MQVMFIPCSFDTTDMTVFVNSLDPAVSQYELSFRKNAAAGLVCCTAIVAVPLPARILLVMTEPSAAKSCDDISFAFATVILPIPAPLKLKLPTEGCDTIQFTSSKEYVL